MSFCFPVPKSNYRRTNFYSFLKAWDCLGEGAEAPQDLFILFFIIFFFTFSPSFSTSNQGGSIHASPFSTLLIFNSSCFALPLSYLMGGGGPRNPPRSSRCVCPPSLCPPRHLSPRQPHGTDRKWRDAELIGQEATLAAATHIKSVREAEGLLSAWHRASVGGVGACTSSPGHWSSPASPWSFCFRSQSQDCRSPSHLHHVCRFIASHIHTHTQGELR